MRHAAVVLAAQLSHALAPGRLAFVAMPSVDVSTTTPRFAWVAAHHTVACRSWPRPLRRPSRGRTRDNPKNNVTDTIFSKARTCTKGRSTRLVSSRRPFEYFEQSDPGKFKLLIDPVVTTAQNFDEL